MLGGAAPYVVAISALLFCGISALTLIYTVNHFDPPDAATSTERADERVVV